jgi:hypothetical protein
MNIFLNVHQIFPCRNKRRQNKHGERIQLSNNEVGRVVMLWPIRCCGLYFNWTSLFIHTVQHVCAWRDLPGHRHGKLFIGRPCKKRADDLLRLSTPQLKMAVAILTGHTPVQRHLMGLSDEDPTCRFCRMETETVQHSICCCEALAR